MVWEGFFDDGSTPQIFHFNSSLDGLGATFEKLYDKTQSDFNSSLDGLGALTKISNVISLGISIPVWMVWEYQAC